MSADMWLRVLLPSLSKPRICYICSAVSVNANSLYLRSEVKLSAFIAHQESRSALTWDALFWVSSLIWPDIKHVWHPVLRGLPLKLFQEVSMAHNISADILNKAYVNSGFFFKKTTSERVTRGHCFKNLLENLCLLSFLMLNKGYWCFCVIARTEI